MNHDKPTPPMMQILRQMIRGQKVDRDRGHKNCLDAMVKRGLLDKKYIITPHGKEMFDHWK